MKMLTFWERLTMRKMSTVALVLGSLLSMGCNSLTGLEGFDAEESDDDGSSAAAATSGGNQAATGGAVGIGDKPAPPLLNCSWPEGGEVGKAIGQTLPSDMLWEGYLAGMDPNGPPTTVSITDFFDCDGSKGVDAVAFDTSQFG